MDQTEFDRVDAATAWDRLLTEYAAARPDTDLVPCWTELIRTVTGVGEEEVEEQVRGYAPRPAAARAADVVVLEV
ncbi:MAG: hypothetical protein GEV09_28390, partial [Pseudonocardiaceae bacterium]|nr:hypothetical protein [Pseudonocardiaceae bacterium]